MKVILTIAFDGDRDGFVDAMVTELQALIGDGVARQATLDVRMPDDELEAFGPELMQHRDERAVVSLWDVDEAGGLALPMPTAARVVGSYRVDEFVKKPYEQTWASGTQSPGFKMIALLRRRPDLTQAAFSEHWRERHGPLAVSRQPGFWHYVQNHVLDRLETSSPEWHGIGEIHYRTVEDALTRSYDSEEAQQLIWEDVARFLDYEGSPTLVTHEWVVTQ